MFDHTPSRLFNKQTWILLGFIFLLSFFTYFFRYWEPQRVYWDENYHIASAQKYLHGVYFMEQHPPLGKLLIALGEEMLHPNAHADQFLNTDYGSDFPDDFSFVGYRFFPALFAWLAAPLLFLIFLFLTRHSLFSTLLSFFYVFDNALIVHLRGAMLEGPLLFFCALQILSFFLLLEWGKKPRAWIWLSLLFGVSFGLVGTTKLFGLALVLLLPAYLYTLIPHWKRIAHVTGLFALGFLLVYVTVWQIHFSLGKSIQPGLPDDGYYQASEEYKAILASGTSSSWINFPIMLRDSLAYVPFYNRGAPRLDLCKSDENGSPFYLWPLGARSINYRWETPDGQVYHYLYLQSNPVVWLVAFAGLLAGIALLIGSVVFELREPLKYRFLLTVFVGLYVSYMIAISQIERVLYLYHYFIPLFLSFIVFAIVFMELPRIAHWRLTEKRKSTILFVLAALIFISFEFYRPLTYYEGLTDDQFQKRALLPVWELACVHCDRVNSLAVACK